MSILLLLSFFMQVIFRKIADVKREQERQKNEVTLTIPEDHPVRKLFQRFKQQREAQTPGESQTYCDRNCVQVESQQRHNHTDSNSFPQSQCVSSLQQEYDSTLRNNSACSGGGSTVATPHAFVQAEKSEKNCTQEAGESGPRLCAESQLNSRAQGSGPGSGVTCSRGARGWAKFRNATSAAPTPHAVEEEKQTQKAEEWPKGQSPGGTAATINTGEGGEMGGNGAGEPGEETSALHKTDSCDSGITKSDLRIDRAGDSRSSFERSPMEKSPMERNPFEHSPGVDSEVSLKNTLVQPASEQALLQATLHEAKLELKGDIQVLSGRLTVLESQVSEVLRLLSVKRRLSLPPTTTAKPRLKNHDSVTASRLVTPKKDDGPF